MNSMELTLNEFKEFFLSQLKAHVELFGLDFTKFIKPFLLGPSGIGKSEVLFNLKDEIQEFIKTKGYKEKVVYCYLPASDLEASVSQVLYDPECKRLKVMPLNLDPDKVTILFIDEASNASPGFQGQLQSLLTSHQIGDFYFPKLIVVLAGNRAKDSILVNDFASTNVRRVCIFNIKFSPDDMAQYLIDKINSISALPVKISSILSGAISYFVQTYASKIKQELDSTSSLEEGQTFSPRQFEQFLLSVVRECIAEKVEEPADLIKLLQKPIVTALSQGLIGLSASHGFIESVAAVISDSVTLKDYFSKGIDKFEEQAISNPAVYNKIAVLIINENYKEDLSHVSENVDFVVNNILGSNIPITSKIDITAQILHKLKTLFGSNEAINSAIRDSAQRLNTLVIDNVDKLDEATLAIYSKTLTDML